MKVFHCDHCSYLIFFENFHCVNCNHAVAYLPDLAVVGSLEPVGNGLWSSPLPRAKGRKHRLCVNYTQENVCNWAIPADDPNPFCSSCRLDRVIPNLSIDGNRTAWYRLELAKRRLVYTLLVLKLPLVSRQQDSQGGLAFEFLADPIDPAAPRVLTGHDNGVITVNLAEVDDAERERRRLQMHEPYRTLLGHFRHEIGHFYWERLIRDSRRLESFRELFGDERADYGEALKKHHTNGPPPDWQERFVSAYASTHPWEDWAETWAHYLHMTDALETASDCGLQMQPDRRGDPTLEGVADPVVAPRSFDVMMSEWLPLTYMLNNLNRGLGLPDGYPFILSEPMTKKLRFIHDTIQTSREKSPRETAAVA